jgi:hypothetical protein
VAEDPSPAEVPLPAEVPPPATTGPVDALAVGALEFQRGAIGGVRATDVSARLAVVGGIAANDASVEMGVVSGILARDVTLHRGVVRGVVAQQVNVEQALVRSVVANRVETGPSTAILIAVARRIDGEAKVLLDWRGGLAFGASLGAFLALAWLGRRRS